MTCYSYLSTYLTIYRVIQILTPPSPAKITWMSVKLMIIPDNTANLKKVCQISRSEIQGFELYDHFTKMCKIAILHWKMQIFDTLLYILRHKTKSKHDQKTNKPILESWIIQLHSIYATPPISYDFLQILKK